MTSNSESNETWVMKAIDCISCGKELGIRMTKIHEIDYFYCSDCHKTEHIAKGRDLVKIYNERMCFINPEIGYLNKRNLLQ